MFRRRIFAAIVTGVVATSSIALTFVPSEAADPPTRPVDTDIRDYVVFGSQTVSIKGSDIPGRGLIRGGDVGANGDTSGLFSLGLIGNQDATVNICANKHITMSQGSQVVGDTVRISPNCNFWDVFVNLLKGGPPGPTHSFTQPVGPFPLIIEPPFPDYSCNPSSPFTLPAGSASAALPPGAYGDVEFQDNTTVTLSAGLYQMCNLHLGQSVHLIAGRGTIVQITGSLDIRNGSEFAMEDPCSTFVYVRGDGVGLNDSSINFGKNTEAAGHFRSLGKINLGNGTNLFGTFWGGSVISDFDINITYCPVTGEVPLTKAITGSGAGLQGEIRIDITCEPAPPNTNPIPPFIIPAGATGSVSTIVTDITLPALCTFTETNNGDNDVVDVVQPLPPGLGATPAPPEVPLCPDVGVTNPDPLSGRRAQLTPFSMSNLVETTNSTTAETTTTTTTTTTVVTPPVPESQCVLPPEFTSLPPLPDTSGAALPATGGGSSSWEIELIALIAATVGVVLVLIARRRSPRQVPN